VLPSSKRPPRSPEPSEVIRTGDYEVVPSSSSQRSAARRPSERPRVFQKVADDEDKTLLFSNSVRSMLPPRPQTPVTTPPIAKAGKVPNMNLRGLTRQSERPPSPESLRGSVRPRMDTEDRTMLRPTSTMPPPMQRMATPAAGMPPSPRPPSARPPAMMPTPYMPNMPIRPAAPVAKAQTIAVNAPGGTDSRKPSPSDPHGDPPSAVITAKTRVSTPRSTVSWAVGLMALGTLVGLVTAVVARGDADAILDATASFVDPSHATVSHANGAVAQAAVLPSFVETSRKTAPLGTDSNPAPGACIDGSATTTVVSTPVVVNSPPPAVHATEAKTASLAGADPSAASRPAPPKPAPLAFAAPARPAPRPAPAAAPVAPKESAPSSGWLANITPPNSGGPIARPSKSGGKPAGNDFESAAAADALAKAQLEASLR